MIDILGELLAYLFPHGFADGQGIDRFIQFPEPPPGPISDFPLGQKFFIRRQQFPFLFLSPLISHFEPAGFKARPVMTYPFRFLPETPLHEQTFSFFFVQADRTGSADPVSEFVRDDVDYEMQGLFHGAALYLMGMLKFCSRLILFFAVWLCIGEVDVVITSSREAQ